MQILTPYFERPLVLVSKISPEQNTDFYCPYPKLDMYKKSTDFHFSENLTSHFVPLYIFRITFNSF